MDVPALLALIGFGYGIPIALHIQAVPKGQRVLDPAAAKLGG